MKYITESRAAIATSTSNCDCPKGSVKGYKESRQSGQALLLQSFDTKREIRNTGLVHFVRELCRGDRTPVLLDLARLKFLRKGVRCQVQILSKELELDASEVPVPKDCPIIELIVLDDSRATIELLVASIPEYQSYKVVDHWHVIDDEHPFEFFLPARLVRVGS